MSVAEPRQRRSVMKWVVAACLVLGAAGWMALRHVGERVHRHRCHIKVRRISIAILQYAANHEEQYPMELHVLLRDEYLKRLHDFICGSSGKRPRKGLWDRDPKTITKEELEEFNCYVIVRGATPDWPPEFIILHEKDNHKGAGRNCLFANGRTEWLAEDEFQRRMKAQRATIREAEELELDWNSPYDWVDPACVPR